ncbi:MAG TPA: DnaJ domain-containing protein [Polyangia bacterium]|nr:DnaJ domain-containing protein [Polyangia bacterium]
MSAAGIDLYAVLGVARSATAADLRRAYRRLALEHHPDRAGAASAPTFAAIADAYRVLSNPLARSTYDATLVERAAWQNRDGGTVHSGGVDWKVGTKVGTPGWQVTRGTAPPDLLPRLSGKLDELRARGVVRTDGDGAIELVLTSAEARAGGTAAIQMNVTVTCASCGGVARPRGVWCRICEYQGTTTENVVIPIRVPIGVRTGARLEVPYSRARQPLSVRFALGEP